MPLFRALEKCEKRTAALQEFARRLFHKQEFIPYATHTLVARSLWLFGSTSVSKVTF